MTKSLMNTQQTALVKCVGISTCAAFGISKIEPSKRPSKSSVTVRGESSSSPSRQIRQQKYTTLRRERLRPASLLPVVQPLGGGSKKQKSNFEAYTISRQLDKKQRFDLFMRRLAMKPAVSDKDQAIQLLNRTIIEVEDRYAPQKNNKFYAINSKRYGRMHPIPDDRIKLNAETGITELLSVGLVTYIHPNGSFEMWTVPRGRNEPRRIFKKNALPAPKPSEIDNENDDNDDVDVKIKKTTTDTHSN